MDLYLRKVDHPQAHDNYRVILKQEDDEIEIGSIGVQLFHVEHLEGWTWGIDTVIPMREIETHGKGSSRNDCMKQFRKAWEKFCNDTGRLEEFLVAKRRRR